MTKGPLDRAIRIFIALGVGALYLTGSIGGILALVLGAFAVVFVLTSLVGACPLYFPFGINTRRYQNG